VPVIGGEWSLCAVSSFDLHAGSQHSAWECNVNDCLAAGDGDVISSSFVWLTQ